MSFRALFKASTTADNASLRMNSERLQYTYREVNRLMVNIDGGCRALVPCSKNTCTKGLSDINGSGSEKSTQGLTSSGKFVLER